MTSFEANDSTRYYCPKKPEWEEAASNVATTIHEGKFISIPPDPTTPRFADHDIPLLAAITRLRLSGKFLRLTEITQSYPKTTNNP
jgi:hypothetical protein